MKNIKYLIIAVLAITCSNSYSQMKFATYDNTYAEKTYDIRISTKEKNGFTLWIDALSVDKLNEFGGLMMNEKQYRSFISGLNEAKLKYEDWVKTAKENNVKELNKIMPIKSKIAGYFRYGNDWYYQDLVNLAFNFWIVESEGELKYFLIARTGELQSSSNQFIDVDGFVLVFSSTAEIEEFVNAISLREINDFYNKPKVDDLFK